MTEADWNTCTKPEKMLAFLLRAGGVSERKLNFVACACCRRIWDYMPDCRSREAVEVLERYADGLANDAEREQAGRAAVTPIGEIRQRPGSWDRELLAADAATMALDWTGGSRCAKAMSCARFVVLEGRRSGRAADRRGGAKARAEMAYQCGLLRDIFGPWPFRPLPPLDAAWLTWNDDLVRRLAEDAYEQRVMPAGTLGPDRLAVLADALLDAGCSDAELLAHLRSLGPHVRGCVAVDRVLGRE
jgi:hypothetical protein